MKINTSYLKAFIIDTRMMPERFCIVLDENLQILLFKI